MSTPPIALEKLMLYTRDWCGYCTLVKRAAAELGVIIEERNIWDNPQWEAELFAARGRHTVPVLRRDTVEGKTEWLGESRDIISFLAQYANSTDRHVDPVSSDTFLSPHH